MSRVERSQYYTNANFRSSQHQELHTTKEELEDLQMIQQQLTEQTLSDPNSSAPTTTSNHDWELKNEQFLEKEKEYQAHIRELQAELDNLQSSLPTTSNHDWEQKYNQLLEKEKEYQTHIDELQAELDDLQDVDLDREKLEKEKAGLVQKCKDIFEEHQTTLQGTYHSIDFY